MRMRRKPNLIPRMERCAHVLVTEPEALKGRWLEEFPGHSRLFIELGCGKGRFTAGTGEANPDALLAAVERVDDAMVVGMERVCEAELENVRFMSRDVSKLREYFADSEADRIYINFCDPWPSNRHARRRLTAPEFLEMYSAVLKDGGEIHFKTDNRPLFDWSLKQFAKCGWELREVTNDLHADGINGIMTDYEAKFHAEGVKINRCVAVNKKQS